MSGYHVSNGPLFERFAQAQNVERVSARIARHVVEFCRERIGQQFHADDLRAYVTSKSEGAPSSPDRILRDLRQRGVVTYDVISRKGSLYRVTGVKP